MEKNRPRGRKKTSSGESKVVTRRGEGLGGKQIGEGFGRRSDRSGEQRKDSGRPSDGDTDGGRGPRRSGYGGGPRRSSGGRGCLTLLVVILIIYVFIRVGSGPLLGGSGDYSTADVINAGNGVSTGWTGESNSGGEVIETVSDEARNRFTTIKGDGKDIVTIMVYMCGTDLESRSAMGTNDLNEMLSADIGDNVNLLVYTGGCNRWRNNLVSSQTNQIYKIQNNDIECLVSNDGRKSMTDPDTLEDFIKWSKKNYPANRYDLILWDHGTGSVNGYGYDEKFANSGSMTLAQINSALKNAGVKFDFVGFDACLMATQETATMLTDDADYLIASEETEPGIGWYYTDWLEELSENPSMPTTEIGKNIIDTFVTTCEKVTPGQQATLSLVDLAEFSATVPSKMSYFSASVSDLIGNGGYSQVSKARGMAKEFATGNKLDQVDLIHFGTLLNTDESNDLVDALRSTVKYNRTSKNVSNAYGLSIYFPYQSFSYVSSATNMYQSIGVSSDYISCIQKFAQYQASGQAVSGGSSSPSWSLYGDSGSSYSMNYEDAYDILSLLLGGRYQEVDRLQLDGLTSDNADFLADNDFDVESVVNEVQENRITEEVLSWNTDGEQPILSLTEEQWGTVVAVDLAMFVRDGDGYIELGRDNIYDWTDDGDLIADTSHDWVAIDGQPVAYYHQETLDVSDDEYTIWGTVPVLYNEQRANLILAFDQDNEEGYVAGISYDYENTDAIAKNLTGLEEGDTIDFIAGYYSKAGDFEDNYMIGDTYEVANPDEIEIQNVNIGNDGVKIGYVIKDIYGQEYWTEMLG